jgi:hypothetical protein
MPIFKYIYINSVAYQISKVNPWDEIGGSLGRLVVLGIMNLKNLHI